MVPSTDGQTRDATKIVAEETSGNAGYVRLLRLRIIENDKTEIQMYELLHGADLHRLIAEARNRKVVESE